LFFGFLVLPLVEDSPRQAVPVHVADGAGKRGAWATRAVDAALAAALDCCISSMRSMLRARRKEGSGSVMEMMVAADANRGPRPRSVLRTRARLETGESLSARESESCF
jgi:hypothetical protein